MEYSSRALFPCWGSSASVAVTLATVVPGGQGEMRVGGGGVDGRTGRDMGVSFVPRSLPSPLRPNKVITPRYPHWAFLAMALRWGGRLWGGR